MIPPVIFDRSMDHDELVTKANYLTFALMAALACLKDGKYEPVKHACNILEQALDALRENESK